MRMIRISAIALAIAWALSGCSSTGKARGEGEGGWLPGAGGPGLGRYGDGYGGGAYASGGRYGSAGPQGEETPNSLGPAIPNDASAPLGNTIIYFQYDSSEVLPEFVTVINQSARYLASNRGRKVVLEGHADERGSPEYNIALGEQRAKAVAKLMKLQGVSESQIQLVSFGEEKPQVFTHDEAAWQKNRRVEILYPGN